MLALSHGYDAEAQMAGDGQILDGQDAQNSVQHNPTLTGPVEAFKDGSLGYEAEPQAKTEHLKRKSSMPKKYPASKKIVVQRPIETHQMFSGEESRTVKSPKTPLSDTTKPLQNIPPTARGANRCACQDKLCSDYVHIIPRLNTALTFQGMLPSNALNTPTGLPILQEFGDPRGLLLTLPEAAGQGLSNTGALYMQQPQNPKVNRLSLKCSRKKSYVPEPHPSPLNLSLKKTFKPQNGPTNPQASNCSDEPLEDPSTECVGFLKNLTGLLENIDTPAEVVHIGPPNMDNGGLQPQVRHTPEPQPNDYYTAEDLDYFDKHFSSLQPRSPVAPPGVYDPPSPTSRVNLLTQASTCPDSSTGWNGYQNQSLEVVSSGELSSGATGSSHWDPLSRRLSSPAVQNGIDEGNQSAGPPMLQGNIHPRPMFIPNASQYDSPDAMSELETHFKDIEMMIEELHRYVEYRLFKQGKTVSGDLTDKQMKIFQRFVQCKNEFIQAVEAASTRISAIESYFLDSVAPKEPSIRRKDIG